MTARGPHSVSHRPEMWYQSLWYHHILTSGSPILDTAQGPVDPPLVPLTLRFVTATAVMKSAEWTRPGGCKSDSLTFKMNGGSLLDPGGSNSMCQALTSEGDFLWDSCHTYGKGILFIHDTYGPRVALNLCLRPGERTGNARSSSYCSGPDPRNQSYD
jgi:hypothetical protein